MPRTTDDNVIGILGDDYDPGVDVDIDEIIATASIYFEAVCTPADYTEAHAERIERYLAAHFYQLSVRAAVTEQVGSSSTGNIRVQYESHVGAGLEFTRFGSMAKRLDTTGKLAAADNAANKTIANTKKPVLKYLGKPSDAVT